MKNLLKRWWRRLSWPQNRMLAEWEAQKGVILAFPHEDTDWSDYLEEARQCVVDIAKAIARFEPVYLICRDAAHTKSYFPRLDRITYIEADFNDTWMRDAIALSVRKEGKTHFAGFTFNGWGGKFDATLDNALNDLLFEEGVFGNHYTEYDLVLEGGAVESDGRGVIMTTTSCLHNPNRNPHLDTDEIESHLRASLYATKILWLNSGELEGDDTDGHIDTLARFCDERTIAYVGVPPRSDVHYEAFAAMERELEAFTDSGGRPYKLVSLPFVSPLYYEGERLPATYANFLIINGAVLVPTYGVKEDREALKILQECFPQHEIIGIDCRVLVKQHGSLHCMTMQLAQ